MKLVLALVLALALGASLGHAQATSAAAPAVSADPASAASSVLDAALGAQPLIASQPATDGATAPILGEQRMSTAVEIAVLLTVLSVLPAVLITITSFTRIVIVLSFVRRALSTNELPPNPVIIGLSLFLTTFVMAPTIERVHEKAWAPYRAGQINLEAAGSAAWGELSTFLVANTRKSELALFADLAKADLSQSEGEPPPFRVVVPAFVVSELKTAFQMGFLLFLPFLVIDLVVSSVLLSMGMFMLPPVMISTPLKILLFVLVDGWHLVCESLVTSFKVAA
jgi:flagellar biosynthetic protein FliP